jgi:hypothetical protein
VLVATSRGQRQAAHIAIGNLTNHRQLLPGRSTRGPEYTDLAALGIKTVIDLTEDGDVTETGIVRAVA